MLSKIGWRSKDGSASSKKLAKHVEIDGRDVIWSVAFFDDGKHIVSGGKEGRIRRWRVEDGTEVGTPMDAQSIIGGLAVSGDGKWIVSGAGLRRVTVWNAEDYSKTREFRGHTSYVYAVDISPDATKMATGSVDGTVCVWSLPRGQRLLGPLQLPKHVVVVKFSPDGRLIATATWSPHSIQICDSQDGRRLVDVPIHVSSSFNQSAAWAHDNKRLFVLSSDGTIYCFDASTGATLSKWHTRSTTTDAKCIALANNGTFVAVSAGSSVSFWNTTTHKRIGSLIRHPADIESMAISKTYDILIGGDKKITLWNLCDVIPSFYYEDMLREREMQDTRAEIAKLEGTLRTQEQSSNDRITHLESTIQELRNELVESRRATNQEADVLNKTIKTLSVKDESSTSKIAHLEQTIERLRMQLADSQHKVDEKASIITTLDNLLRAHERQPHCEALYAAGRIHDAAESLMEVGNIGNDEARANLRIVDWVKEFTHRCAVSLENAGDKALETKRVDEALQAYSTALSLAPPCPKTLLIKWVSTMMVHGSANEVPSASAKFKLSKFLVHQAICDVLEKHGHVTEAIACFRQMQHELAEDTGIPTEQATWEPDFRARCVGKLEKLSDAAIDAKNFEEAIKYYSCALSLGPLDCSKILAKRSQARAVLGLWEEALVDADKIIELNPSCYKGYERKHAALHGMGRYMEAFKAFSVMLSKLEQASDPHISDLRHQFIDPSPIIRDVVQQTIRHLPRILIDTTTGRLYDGTQQAAAFEELPIYHEMRSSMTTRLDCERISREVKEYYRYVMLSHRWDSELEPSFQTVEHISVYELEKSPTNTKLQTFCSFMGSLGFKWVWSDTCCINKKDNVVLQESLIAMFTWYHGSSLTIVYLRGVSSESQPGDLQRSSWNTRAWTYQEYLAAKNVQFYTEDWKPYLGLDMFNHKDSPAIISEMEKVSGVSVQELAVLRPGLDKVREKLFLASKRQTTRVEDIAYSLLGIFHAAIPVMYGEGTRAVGRLLEYILTGSRDVTILAWTGCAGGYNSCFPLDLTVYNEIVPPHFSQLIKATGMDRMMESRLSSPDLSHVVALHDRLHGLPSPSMFASRLQLPGIVFPIIELVRISESDPITNHRVYRASTAMLGNVEIKTSDNLTEMNALYLVHPWIRPLLDQEYLDGTAGLDMIKKALRLVARLMHPFGALLFKLVSRAEYERVAADCLIMAQVSEGVSLSGLIDGIQTIEVL